MGFDLAQQGASPDTFVQALMGGNQTRQQAAANVTQAGSAVGSTGTNMAQIGASIRNTKEMANAQKYAANMQLAASGLSFISDMTSMGLSAGLKNKELGMAAADKAAETQGWNTALNKYTETGGDVSGTGKPFFGDTPSQSFSLSGKQAVTDVGSNLEKSAMRFTL